VLFIFQIVEYQDFRAKIFRNGLRGRCMPVFTGAQCATFASAVDA
jgi:hypothetical protein